MKFFISHSSKNKNYGNELINLLTGVGVKDEEIIFTSNDAYGIPIGKGIFHWLKSRISEKPHVLYLLSPEYYQSVACLNEMGAAWVVENEHTMIFTPKFDLSSPGFLQGAIDPREIGFYIDNHDKLIAFIESLRINFSISKNPVLINQKIRLFIENIKKFDIKINLIPELQIITSNEDLSKKTNHENHKAEIITKQTTNNTLSKSSQSRLISDLEKNKLKDEDVLLIHYILENGRFKLGTGWKAGPEISNIKIWEEVQELKEILSINYENALRRFEMKNATEVSETTGGGNARELSIKDEIKDELLNLSDSHLSIIDEVFKRNQKTNT